MAPTKLLNDTRKLFKLVVPVRSIKGTPVIELTSKSNKVKSGKLVKLFGIVPTRAFSNRLSVTSDDDRTWISSGRGPAKLLDARNRNRTTSE